MLLASSRVRADAVPPPPDNCPNGAVGITGHSGTWCEASTCSLGNTCDTRYGDDALRCGTQGLCVRSESYSPGGRRAFEDRAVRLTRQVADATCRAGETCADGSRCVVAQRCVRATLLDAFNPKNAGCGCALAGRGGASLGLGLSLLGALALCAARLRRRR
jgi:dissimilatory sulfite reductase (desulfoviridin) alpha/beta subunit